MKLSLVFVISIYVVTAQRNCIVQNATSIISKTVIQESDIQSAQACAEACERNADCCAGEFEPPKQAGWKPHCFLLSNITIQSNPSAPTSTIICTPNCSAPAPPPGPAPAAPSVQNVVAPQEAVPVNGIVEWSMDIEGLNPTGALQPGRIWNAASITLTLTPPPAAKPIYAPIKGYKYQQQGTEWRIKAVLQGEGTYQYKLVVEWNNLQIYSAAGAVQASSAAPAQPTSIGPKGFLRPQFHRYPYRSVYEDGTLFQGFGLGDCLNDNFTFPTFNTSNPKHPFDRDLDTYLTDYGEAGWKMFRWSNGNCAFSIIDEYGFDGSPGNANGNQYNDKAFVLLDQFYDALRTHDYSVWHVPFQKRQKFPMFPNMGDGNTTYHRAQRAAMFAYLDIVIARYSAQTDFWSMTNEQRTTPDWFDVLHDYVRANDPYRHPITTSWNDHMENRSYEIDSAHWYHSDDENAQTADDAAVEYFDSGLQYKKPVVLTESGNAAHNWDAVSHLRMRIRSWIAFFKGVMLIWWNTSGSQSCRPCGGGNMYLGEQERSYQKYLTEFASNMTDPNVTSFNFSATSTTSAPVTAFGISGAGVDDKSTVSMVYLHHQDHNSNTSSVFSLPNLPKSECKCRWYSPESGTAVAAHQQEGSTFATPPFAVDIALLAVCSSSTGGSLQ